MTPLVFSLEQLLLRLHGEPEKKKTTIALLRDSLGSFCAKSFCDMEQRKDIKQHWLDEIRSSSAQLATQDFCKGKSSVLIAFDGAICVAALDV